MKRIDTPDTMDAVLRLLAGFQADGWGVKDVKFEIEHASVSTKHRRLPVGATVIVRLAPG